MGHRFVETSRVLGIVLAGGDGTRLYPLILPRAKPAVPIGGHHKLIDIPVSNLLNSGVTHNYVVVQYQAATLIQHLEGYQNGIAQMRKQFIRVLTPPKDVPRFFESDADSIVQLHRQFESSDADIVVMMMADQIIKIDIRQAIHALLENSADAIMVYRTVPIGKARLNLGVLELDDHDTVKSMEEKPRNPKPVPNQPDLCNANLALYVFTMEAFLEMFRYVEGSCEPHQKLSTTGIPWLIGTKYVLGHDLAKNIIPGMTARERGFFRDVGTLDAWFEVQMELCHRDTVLNLYSRNWPYFTAPVWPTAPAKLDSIRGCNQTLLGPNVICQDGVLIQESVLSTGAIVGQGSSLEQTVILDNAEVGRNCILRRVVIEEGVKVPDGTILGDTVIPQDAVPFDVVYGQIERGEEVPRNRSVVSSKGILFVPQSYFL